MSHPQRGQRGTVVIIGGKGGMFARYREAVESRGYELRHYERRVPSKHGPTPAKIALVIVMVSMVSHPLLSVARTMARGDTAIVYLKSPAVSAVKDTVARLA